MTSSASSPVSILASISARCSLSARFRASALNLITSARALSLIVILACALALVWKSTVIFSTIIPLLFFLSALYCKWIHLSVGKSTVSFLKSSPPLKTTNLILFCLEALANFKVFPKTTPICLPFLSASDLFSHLTTISPGLRPDTFCPSFSLLTSAFNFAMLSMRIFVTTPPLIPFIGGSALRSTVYHASLEKAMSTGSSSGSPPLITLSCNGAKCFLASSSEKSKTD
mmetsp:Transcript_10519/g.15680  ORF Transcript_10519/g.15680 Transcript_10519/m.15680 type:complete len:229 (+) Transcript_10519:1539-2225(+)